MPSTGLIFFFLMPFDSLELCDHITYFFFPFFFEVLYGTRYVICCCGTRGVAHKKNIQPDKKRPRNSRPAEKSVSDLSSRSPHILPREMLIVQRTYGTSGSKTGAKPRVGAAGNETTEIIVSNEWCTAAAWHTRSTTLALLHTRLHTHRPPHTEDAKQPEETCCTTPPPPPQRPNKLLDKQ